MINIVYNIVPTVNAELVYIVSSTVVMWHHQWEVVYAMESAVVWIHRLWDLSKLINRKKQKKRERERERESNLFYYSNQTIIYVV